MLKEVKDCPLCGEEILSVAVKCKHCGSDLREENGELKAELEPKVDYGIFLLAIPAVTTVLIWVWVSQLNLFQSPSSMMMLLMVATIFGTAIVAAMEASKVGIKSDDHIGTYGPKGWFVAIVLLWFISYPAYLYKRKYAGLSNHLLAGVILVFVFLSSWSVMNLAIESTKDEVRGEIHNLQQHFESFGR